MNYFSLLVSMLVISSAARADVVDAGTNGFNTVNEAVVAAERDIVWRAAIDEIGQWWSSDHTVSGDATRLRISAKTQGCFCEYFGDGDGDGVVHMTVTMVNPGVVIRLTGGLGPLGLMGVAGNMTWEFSSVEGGTHVKFTYAVGGYRANGLDEIAGPVDRVIADALDRLRSHVESRSAVVD